MSDPATPHLPDGPATLAELPETLKAEHTLMVAKTEALSLSLAFGGLFFLQQLDEVSPLPGHPCLLKLAWLSAGVSCISGSLNLLLRTVYHLRAANLLESAIQKNVDLSTPAAQAHLSERLDAYMWRGIPLFVHLGALGFLFLVVLAYKLTS